MKIKLLSALFVFFSAFAFISCDTEPIDQSLVNQNPDDENPDDGGSGGGGGSTTGDYWPMAIDNQWQFESSEPQNDDPMKIIGTETIDGIQYYRVNYAFQDSGTSDLTGTATVYLRKEDGVYYERIQVHIPEQTGLEVTISPYELIVLKDLPVGQSWTDTTTQVTSYQSTDPEIPIDIPDTESTLDITGTVLEKGVSLTVNGTNYTNVIKIKWEQDVTIDMGIGVPTTSSTTTYMWFAKNVGPIKSQTTTSTGESSLTELVSYIVN